MTQPTRKSVIEKIDNVIKNHADQWDVLHDHTEPTSEGIFFRMTVFQAKTNDARGSRNIMIHATPFWSEPVKIYVRPEFNSNRLEFDVNWSSGGVIPGATNKEIAHAMIAMWSWVSDYLAKHEKG
jgi:hypothetical protein